MSGRKEIIEMKKLLSEYIENLDKGVDRTDLLDALKRYKEISDEYENVYKEAALAQYFFYSSLAEKRIPTMRKRFQELRNKIAHGAHSDIWTYLEYAMEQKGLAWRDVLSRMGANPRLAGQIINRNLTVQRIPPHVLANISSLIEADPNQVLRLSYANLKSESESLDYGRATHFRAAFDHKVGSSGCEQKPTDAILQYLRELEKALNESNQR